MDNFSQFFFKNNKTNKQEQNNSLHPQKKSPAHSSLKSIPSNKMTKISIFLKLKQNEKIRHLV